MHDSSADTPTQSTYVSIDQIRDYLMDRTPDDNEIEFDLTFTDDEIAKAMQHAARDYNSVPPIGINVDPHRLSAHTNMFFDGTLVHLYTSLIAKMRRNDIEYTAGGVSTHIVAARIKNLKEARTEHRELFERAVRDEKVTINLKRAYGRVG